MMIYRGVCISHAVRRVRLDAERTIRGFRGVPLTSDSVKTIFRIIAGRRVSDGDTKLCLYSKAFTAFPEKSENDSPMRKESDSKYNRL